MRNLFKFTAFTAIAIAIAATTGCSRATVPPAAKGKIVSTEGYSKDIKGTGRYWLFWNEKLVILDTSTQTYTERMSVKMADEQTLTFDVRFRTRIAGDDKTINTMFNDIRPVATSDSNVQEVSLVNVYNVYGSATVQNAARSVISKYRTEEVAANFDKITNDMQAELTKRMINTPLEVSNITLGNLDYPKVISEAIEKQAERELAIKTEQNNQAVEMVKKTNALKLAQADYDIRMTRAKALRDENAMTAAGLSPMLLEYRKLEVMEKMTENKNSVFVPYDALGQSGLSNRVFSESANKQ
ncbi:SPFH domain-containing protein [Pseudomonas luteola]